MRAWHAWLKGIGASFMCAELHWETGVACSYRNDAAPGLVRFDGIHRWADRNRRLPHFWSTPLDQLQIRRLRARVALFGPAWTNEHDRRGADPRRQRRLPHPVRRCEPVRVVPERRSDATEESCPRGHRRPRLERSHLVRGLLDGDGSILNYMYQGTGKARGTYEALRTVFNSASRAHVEWLRERLRSTLGIWGSIGTHQANNRIHPMHRLAYANHESSRLLPWLYSGLDVPCLHRKRVIWDSYAARHELDGGLK